MIINISLILFFISIVFVLLSILLISKPISKFRYLKTKKDTKLELIDSLVTILKKNKGIKKSARLFCIINTKSLDYNINIVLIIRLLTTLFLIIIFLLVKQLWYLKLFQIGMILVIGIVLREFLLELMKLKFISSLPDTYQILHVQFINNDEKVLPLKKILTECLPNFDRPIKHEIERFLAVESKNDFSRNELNKLKEIYSNKYYSYLLDLFYEIRIGGSSSELLESCARMNFSLRKIIEYTKTRNSYKMAYMILNLGLIYILSRADAFAGSIIGEKLIKEFYTLPHMVLFKIAIYVAILFNIAILYYSGGDDVDG